MEDTNNSDNPQKSTEDENLSEDEYPGSESDNEV